MCGSADRDGLGALEEEKKTVLDLVKINNK